MRTFLCALALLSVPAAASAHGAMQKVAGPYIVNLTAAHMSPLAGEEQSFVLAFSDIETQELIQKTAAVDVVLQKNGATHMELRDAKTENGLLSFRHTYREPGLYELFLSFRFEGEETLYEPEDFFIEVRDAPSGATSATANATFFLPLATVAVGLAGLIGGFVAGRAHHSRP